METPVHAPYRERVRIEIKKLREMPFKKKMEYIWDYYKIPIIVTIAIIFVIGSFINSRFINPAPDAALFVVWNAGFATDEQLNSMKETFETKIIDEEKNEDVIITTFFTMAEDPSISMINIQRLAAMLAAGEIDVFLVGSQMLEEYALLGYLQPMESVLAEIRVINPAVYERINENIVRGDIETEDRSTAERIIGINVSDSSLVNKIGFYVNELFFGISITAGQKENATTALITLFE